MIIAEYGRLPKGIPRCGSRGRGAADVRGPEYSNRNLSCIAVRASSVSALSVTVTVNSA